MMISEGGASVISAAGRGSSKGRLSYTVLGGPPTLGARHSSAGHMRVSVHGNGTDFHEVEKGPEKETLVDMFLSGRTSQRIEEEVRLATENVEDILDVEMIVDPPCIAPFEDEEENAGTRLNKHSSVVGQAPQEYWKHHAQWKKADAAVSQRRTQVTSFVEQWAKKNGMEFLVDGKGQTESVQEMIKRKTATKTKSKIMNSFRSGQLDLTEGFVNISGYPIGIRKISSMAEDQKTGEVILPGEPVMIDRIAEKDEMRFLKLADGRGWVFDQQGDLMVMAKMEEIDIGDTWYRVVCKELIDVRRAPVYEDEAKTGRLLTQRELVVVSIKCRVRGQIFLCLADGTGWVFLTRPNTKKEKRSFVDMVMEECDAEIVHGDTWMAQEDILPVTNDIVEVGLWTYSVAVEGLLALGSKLHGVPLKEGEVLKIDKRCYALGTKPEAGQTGVKWLRLHDGRGWIPEKLSDGKVGAKLQQGGGLSYPSTFKDKLATETVKSGLPKWTMGVV